ncbi:MAG TPA: SDR family oxidoreductase [Longimicrobiaceae bacterium]|nr:SDR family oxidoreductase [Longimicrobiaceae bacterium]
MPKPLSEQVVVVTGASSGIGRCTALHLAARGARVVLTARRAEALEEVVREIEGAGGEALAVPGEVTRQEDLQAVAAAAVRRFGRIDTWVNNAGVYIQGRVQDISLDEYRRVLDVNFVGVVNGTQRALELMLRQGSGVIVQVSSVAAKRGVPYTSAYTASKAAIASFTEAVRSEILGSGVSLSVLYPPTVDTPIYDQGRGKLGVVPKPAPPVADPLEAARAIAHLAETGDRHRYFGWAGPLAALNAAFPALGDWLLHHGEGFTYTGVPADADDNLDSPSERIPATVRAGWQAPGWKGLTVRETVRVLPLESALAAAALGFVAARVLGGATRLRGG